MRETTPRQGDKHDVPILKTKLHRPPATADLLVRHRLLQRLENNRQRPLTLISAPAGFGKSILASMWAETSGTAFGWVSLDEADSDLATFFNYLLSTVEKAFPDFKLGSRALLEASPLPSAAILARYLLNDFDRLEEPLVLVLDDFHRIHEQTIFTLVEELLKYPLPTLHLVLVGRWDPPLPLASLRAYGQVTEIRTSDLRFSADETGHLLEQILDRDVDAEVAAAWTERTEGWVTALRLAALSLQHRGVGGDLNVQFSGDSRYLQDYLLAEVLAHVPPIYREWLLKTSLLDRFCAALCEAVCLEERERPTLGGEAFIDWLDERNFFLIELDEKREWFRFHHLFQEQLRTLLRQQVGAEQIAVLHRRASRWLGDRGWVGEAIQHALAAGDTQSAVALFAQRRHRLMNAEAVNQLGYLVSLFPEEVVAGELILATTRLQLPATDGQAQASSAAEIRALLASRPAEDPVGRELRGEIAVVEGLEAVLFGPGEKGVALGSEALAFLPSQARHLRVQAIALQTLGYQMEGDWDQALTFMEAALGDAQWSPRDRAKLHVNAAWAAFMEGALTTAQSFVHKGLRLALNHKAWRTIGHARYLAGVFHYLRDDLVLAESQSRYFIEDPALSDPVYFASAVCVLARVYEDGRRAEDADQLLQRAIAHLEEAEATFGLGTLRAFQVDLVLGRGEIALAERLSQNTDFEWWRPMWFHYVPQLTSIKLLLARGRATDLKQALALLEELDEKLLAINRRLFRIDVLALRALALAAAGAGEGDAQPALDTLAQALLLAQRGGCIRNLVDLGAPMADLLQQLRQHEAQRHAGARHSTLLPYMDEILAAFPSAESTTAPDGSALIDPLTPRELETLRYLATDLTTSEIADEMLIAISTVRSHVKTVYSKLGVNSRFEAVHSAKELGLL